ncbi:hypothetical protein L1887_09962 [Cichorium endivia]|nr:hypothetical protein L1887_09962 [Cichorium endivia]
MNKDGIGNGKGQAEMGFMTTRGIDEMNKDGIGNGKGQAEMGFRLGLKFLTKVKVKKITIFSFFCLPYSDDEVLLNLVLVEGKQLEQKINWNMNMESRC